jgi:hypothetical protein
LGSDLCQVAQAGNEAYKQGLEAPQNRFST